MKHQTKPSFTLVGKSILIEGTTVHEHRYSKEKRHSILSYLKKEC